jgi:hypothetical protein
VRGLIILPLLPYDPSATLVRYASDKLKFADRFQTSAAVYLRKPHAAAKLHSSCMTWSD